MADGNNGDFADWGSTGFNAGYNYDNTTGLGSMFGINLIYDVALIPTSSNSNPPPPPNGLRSKATPTSVTISWTTVAGDTAYLAVGYYESVPGTVGAYLRRGGKAEFTGLAPHTNYVFQVMAISAGRTAFSVPVYVTTPAG